jgi:hypothetical protein
MYRPAVKSHCSEQYGRRAPRHRRADDRLPAAYVPAPPGAGITHLNYAGGRSKTAAPGAGQRRRRDILFRHALSRRQEGRQRPAAGAPARATTSNVPIPPRAGFPAALASIRVKRGALVAGSGLAGSTLGGCSDGPLLGALEQPAERHDCRDCA